MAKEVVEETETPAKEEYKDASEGKVKVPEIFQKEVDALVYKATKHELDYLRSCVSEREDKLRKESAKAEKPTAFDVEGMPS